MINLAMKKHLRSDRYDIHIIYRKNQKRRKSSSSWVRNHAPGHYYQMI